MNLFQKNFFERNSNTKTPTNNKGKTKIEKIKATANILIKSEKTK